MSKKSAFTDLSKIGFQKEIQKNSKGFKQNEISQGIQTRNQDIWLFQLKRNAVKRYKVSLIIITKTKHDLKICVMHEGNLFGPKHHRLRFKVFYLYYTNNQTNLQFFFLLQIGEFNNKDETHSISTSKVT